MRCDVKPTEITDIAGEYDEPVARRGCRNDQVWQRNGLAVREFTKPSNVARGLKINRQHAICEIRQYRRYQGANLIGAFEFLFTPELEDSSIHLGDCHDGKEYAGAITLQPRRYDNHRD